MTNAKKDEDKEKISRALTPGEMAMARSIYKDSVDYNRVKIHNFPYWAQLPGIPMQTPDDRNIHAIPTPLPAERGYKADYSRIPVRVQPRYDFIHEMAHIWQNQNDVLKQKVAVIGENIRTFFQYHKAYKYDLDDSKDLLDYSMEQQAAILEDYFRLLEGGGKSINPAIKEGSPRTKDLYGKVLANFLKNPKYPRTLKRQKNDPLKRGQQGSK